MKFYSLAAASTFTLASAKLERAVNDLAALQAKIDGGKSLNIIEQTKFSFLEKIAKCDCVKEKINSNFYMACANTGAKITDKDYLSLIEIENIIQEVKNHNANLNADLDEPKILNLAALADKYGNKVVQEKFAKIKVLKNIKQEVAEKEKDQEIKEKNLYPEFSGEIKDRIDCGFLGIGKDACLAKNCYYDETEPSDGSPWCFFKDQDQYDNKTDCGYVGINADQCRNKGCTWKESQVAGEPWCYYKSCKTDNKQECGWFGIDADQCRNQGCCWEESKLQGEPWCFFA